MKVNAKQRKKARRGFEQAFGKEELINRMFHIIQTGKQGLDAFIHESGAMPAEAIMDMEREERSGPECRPASSDIYTRAHQPGSIYVGDQKISVQHPRLRGPRGEIPLASYAALKKPGTFSKELLEKALRGISLQKHHETVIGAAHAFGVSPGSLSRHIVAIAAQKLREFKESDLSSLTPFAVFIDAIHRAGEAFLIALGIDTEGRKHVLGFRQGATENHEVCESLLSDMERRGLVLSGKMLWIADGGKGVIKTLKDRCGKKLLRQRRAIHTDRNIQRHPAKKCRTEAHRRFQTALNAYDDACRMLRDFEKRFRNINESAADSLLEALEDILALHRLKAPALVRKTLTSTNPIESMFSTVRGCEGNITRHRGSSMSHRRLASVLLSCERGFRRVKGCRDINGVVGTIDKLCEEQDRLQTAA